MREHGLKREDVQERERTLLWEATGQPHVSGGNGCKTVVVVTILVILIIFIQDATSIFQLHIVIQLKCTTVRLQYNKILNGHRQILR